MEVMMNQANQALMPVSVAHQQHIFRHGHAHHAAHHLGHAAERNIVNEQQIQIRFAVLNGLVDLAGQDPVEQPCHRILRIEELTDRVIEFQRSGLIPGMHRQFSAQQRLEFPVRHIHNLAVLIRIRRNRGIGILLSGSLDAEGCTQSDILAGSSDHDVIRAAFHFKGFTLHVIIPESIGIKGNRNLLRLSRFQGHAHKPLQFLGRTEYLGPGQCNIELRHLISVHIACVGDVKGNPLVGDIQVVVAEGCITHTETERETDFLSGRLEIAVAHIDALAVLAGRFVSGIIPADRCFAVFHRERLGQFSAGVHFA